MRPWGTVSKTPNAGNSPGQVTQFRQQVNCKGKTDRSCRVQWLAPAWILCHRKIHKVTGKLRLVISYEGLLNRCGNGTVVVYKESSSSGDPQRGAWRGDVCDLLHNTLVGGEVDARDKPGRK